MSAIPSWARVGAKVVCINASRIVMDDGRGCEPDVKPVVGLVYTIKQVCRDDGDPCVYVREVRNWINGTRWLIFKRERPYLLCRFAPVVSDSIEATVFRARKNTAPQKIEERA